VRRSFLEAAKRPAPAVERGLVFTFGGSQGARPLNETAPRALALLHSRSPQLGVHALHQAGKDAVDDVKRAYSDGNTNAEVTPFIDDMVGAYRRAHVVICRAGATSCAEIGALGIPAILVPFPQAADDHQTKNARDLEQAGGCIVLPQSELTAERLADEIERILVDDERRAKLAAGASAWGRIDAGAVVARAALGGFAREGDVEHLLTRAHALAAGGEGAST
jgi:UDP-N-acetylglucosamine--N-acetylmuramyl-(pentapeptide) pyrophosphoryl-undecaprenol N-acetylglucosamine transferase